MVLQADGGSVGSTRSRGCLRRLKEHHPTNFLQTHKPERPLFISQFSSVQFSSFTNRNCVNDPADSCFDVRGVVDVVVRSAAGVVPDGLVLVEDQ